MTAGIYKIINKTNGKYYIGSSQNIERRWETHKSQLNTQKHINIFLQRSWNKYSSDNFELKIIQNCDGYSREEIFLIEQNYLDNLSEETYNLSKNAKGGDNLTNHPNREEIISRITASIIKRYNEMSEEDRKIFSRFGEKNSMFGKTHDEETRKLISGNIKQFYLENDNYISGKTFEEVFGEEEALRRKEILSKSASQRVGDKNPFFGKEHSKESRKIISDSRQGKYHGTQNNPVIINGVYYSSVGVASQELNIPAITIRWRVLSKNKKYITYQYAERKYL